MFVTLHLRNSIGGDSPAFRSAPTGLLGWKQMLFLVENFYGSEH